jgi:hypothetical protein
MRRTLCLRCCSKLRLKSQYVHFSLSAPRKFISMFLLLQILTLPCYTKNITIDDANPAWSYVGTPEPDGTPVWQAITPSTPCTTCWAQPDPSQTYNRTWHDTAWYDHTAASVSFRGTACWVYGICTIANTSGNHLGVNLSFTLNGVAQPSFYYPPCPTYEYNFLLFSASGVNSQVDTELVLSFVSGGGLLIDYLVYDDGLSGPSNSNSTSSSHHSTPIVAVVVPVITVVFLGICAILFFFWRRLNALKKKQSTMEGERHF